MAIPAFRARFIREAVESVVTQSFGDWELIIVDDASPDDISGSIKDFLIDSRIRYYRNDKNYGAVDVIDNWNKCLEYCSGNYVICMGDDDRLVPNSLTLYDSLIHRYPGLGVYHAHTETIDESGNVISEMEHRPEFESSLEMIWRRWNGRHQFIGDFCFERKYLEQCGGFFKLPLAWASDDVSAYRAAKGDGIRLKDGIANTQELAFQYRINSTTISSGGNHRIKIESILSSVLWFNDDFDHRIVAGDHEIELLNKLKTFSPQYMHRYALQYMRDDIASRKGGLGFWRKNMKRYGISPKEFVLQSLKGLVL